jgi:hypothetical protein
MNTNYFLQKGTKGTKGTKAQKSAVETLALRQGRKRMEILTTKCKKSARGLAQNLFGQDSRLRPGMRQSSTALLKSAIENL